MRTCLTRVIFNPFVLVVVGLVLFVLGAGLGFDVRASMLQARRIEQAAHLGGASPGRLAWVEGKIGGQTPVIYRDFVSFVREAYQSCGRSSCWVEVARQTPALTIEQPDGRVFEIANDDYALESTALTVEEAGPTAFKGAVQSRGFAIGTTIVAVGTAKERSGTLALDAEFVSGGTRDQYIDDMRRYTRRAVIGSGACLLLAIICMIVALWQLRQFLRETRQEQRLPRPAPQPGRKQRPRSRR
jgi:hypothetical protein